MSFSLTVNLSTKTSLQHFRKRLIYSLCRQCQNPLILLTDKNDDFNGFNFLKSPSDIEYI